MIIQDLKTTREFFSQKITQPIFGVGVWAFNRLGLEKVFSDYRLLCLRHSPDTELISRDIKVLALEEGLGNKHLKIPRNSTSVLAHSQTKKYLQQFKRPLIIPYKASSKMERICRENDWILGIAPTKFGKNLFENKVVFRRILKDLGVAPTPGEEIPFSQLSFAFGQKKFGLPFVVQHPTRGGGKGTFFIYSREDFDCAYKKLIKAPQLEEGEEAENDVPQEVVVSRFVQGPSPSVAACVTRHGILSTNLQIQVLDIPELFNPKKGSGLFCGHDWTFSQALSPELNRQAATIAQKIGGHFKQEGYQGIFGIDFVLDEKEQRLYVTECNPRMTGAFPTLEMALVESGAPPLMAFHALEYLGVDYELNLSAINQLLQQPKEATHLFLHNLTGRWTHNYGVLKPGVYVLNKQELKLQRPGYQLSDIKTPAEFLITEGVPVYKRHFSPNRRLCRLLTKTAVLGKPGELNPWGKSIAESVYQAFCLKRVWFAKIKKLLNPNYLSKG